MTAPGLDQYQGAVALAQLIEEKYSSQMTVEELLQLAQLKATLGLTAATALFGAAFAEDGTTVYEWRKAFAVPQAPNRNQKSQYSGGSVASRTDR